MRKKSDRRHARRISLEPPQPGTLSCFRVTVRDLSTSGACIQHDCPMLFQPGKRFTLEFDCDGEHLRLTCSVARSRLDKIGSKGTLYTTGVHFIDLNEATAERLWGLIGALAMDVLAHETADEGGYAFAIVNS